MTPQNGSPDASTSTEARTPAGTEAKTLTSDVTPPFIWLPEPSWAPASASWVIRARRGLGAKHRQRNRIAKQVIGLLIITVVAVIAGAVALHSSDRNPSDRTGTAPGAAGAAGDARSTGAAGTAGTPATPTLRGLAGQVLSTSAAAATAVAASADSASPSPSTHASAATKKAKKPAGVRNAKSLTAGQTKNQSATPVAPTPGVYYQVVNNHSGAVLDATNCGTVDGTRVQQWAPLGNTCQRWSFTPTSDGYYTIINQNSGKALDAFNCGTGNGNMTDLWTPLGNQCQEWSLVATGSHFIIANRFSHLVLDDTGCSMNNGAPINQWPTLGNDCQKWALTK